jgi:hypothetical protein
MGKYDARNRGRFSNVGAPPRGMEKLGYVPVVKSAVLDQDEWRDMKRADVDPEWEDEPEEDLPLPDDDLSSIEGDLPLPERASSPENLPVPDLGMTMGDDGDLPLPDLGTSLADGDLPLPRFETLAEDDAGRLGLLPSAPEPLVAMPEPLAVAPENEVRADRVVRTGLRTSAEPALESQPVRIALPEAAARASISVPFSQPPSTDRHSAPAPRKAPWPENDVAGLSLPPMSTPPSAPASAAPAISPATTLSDAPSLASLRAAAAPLLALTARGDEVLDPAREATGPQVLASAPPDASGAAARFQALVAPVQVEAPSSGQTVPPELAGALIGSDAPAVRAARATGGDQPSSPAPAAQLARSGPVPIVEASSAGAQSMARPSGVRPPPAPGVRASSIPSEAERLAHARALVEAGRLEDALALLDPLCVQQPELEACHVLLLDVCCKLPRAAKALAHAEWLMVRCLQTQRPAEAAGIYRLVRATFPELALSERALVAAVEAADRSSDSQVVVDAAKLLVHGYPESAYVPRVLTKTAEQQLVSGRADLARSTLEYLATRYPNDPLAQAARQRLSELFGR